MRLLNENQIPMLIIQIRKTLWAAVLRLHHHMPSTSHKRSRVFVKSTNKPKIYITLKSVVLNPSQLVQINHDLCYVCFNEIRVINHTEGVTVCLRCGNSVDSYDDKPSYTQSYGPAHTISKITQSLPRKVSLNTHKRCNHFKYWLQRIQGHESATIPDGIIDIIRKEIQKRYGCFDYLTYDKVKDVLRYLKMQHLYSHIHYILNKVIGQQIVSLDKDHIRILLGMFMSIQEPFYKFHGHRANMLSYSYILLKFFEILGWDEIIHLLPKFKSREKAHQADRIWKSICSELKWKYNPSV